MRQLGSVLWLLCFAIVPGLMAQSLDVSGKVVLQGSAEDALPGVTITVKGTRLTTVSGSNGDFKISVPDSNEATLVFSFVGFKEQEIVVTSSQSNLKVEMVESLLSVEEEMIVSGFATTVKRRNAANSVATLKADDLAKVPVQTLDGALSGKFTGVSVRSNSGAPGGGISVSLRGAHTINGASQPLWVIDGVIANNQEIQAGLDFVTEAARAGSSTPQGQPTNRIADLNPEDIESIEVLKGPSAAAIYGAKASNGVILVTTKRGKAGKPEYNISFKIGQRSIIKKLGSRRFTRATALAAYGETGAALFDQIADANGNYTPIDYEDLMYGNDGMISELNFSGRGGNEKTRYFFSGLTLDDEGIVERTGYEKNAVRLNLEHHFTDKLSVGLFSNFIKSSSDRGLTGNENRGAVTFGVALAFIPNFVDLRPDADGNYPDAPFSGSNPLHTRDVMRNNETVQRTINSLSLDYSIFANAKQSLDFNIRAGNDFFSLESEALFPRELQFERDSALPGTSVLGESEGKSRNLYFNLSHGYTTSNNNTFNTAVGIQLEEQDTNSVLIVSRGLVPGQSNVDISPNPTVQQNRTLQRDRGFFFQEEINFGEKIYLVAGLRGDSSSANGDTDKYYMFPKGAVSIRLSEYDFWEGLSSFANEFKLRAAWGKTGNLPIPRSKFSSYVPGNIDGQGGLVVSGSRGNPDIEPETSTELEFGFDGGFFDNKATVEFSYYKQTIDDLLLFREVPSSSGFTVESLNGGEMETDGIEFGLSVVPIKTDDFEWFAGFNFFTTDSVITRLDVDSFNVEGGGFATSLGQHVIEEGESATQIKGIVDGQVVKVGDDTPDFQLSWNNNMTYKNYTLSWLLDWKEGGDAINLTKLLHDLGGTTADLDDEEGIARTDPAAPTDTRNWVEDAGYIKLREINLEYRFNKGQLSRLMNGKLRSLRVALSGRDLWRSTDYSSYDPEVSNFGNRPIGGTVEVTPFPSSKSFFLQVSAGL